MGLGVARDGHFCGKSGTQIGGNDHWSPVGLGGRRRPGEIEPPTVVSSGALDGVVSRLMSSEGEYSPRRGRRTMPDSSPRPVDAQCAHVTPKTQTNQRTFGNRKSKRDGRTRLSTSGRQDRL